MEGNPQWCEKHWQPIRDNRAYNGLMAAFALSQELTADLRFQALCGRDDATGQNADVGLLNEKMAEVAPVCCYLTDDAMERVYGAALAAGDAMAQPVTDPEARTVRRDSEEQHG